jgi:hypothetical protein
LNSTLAKISSIADGSAEALARLIRRICLLRERGNEAEAERIESDQLVSAIRDYRLEHGPEALPDEALQSIFTAEKTRATEAVLLAELLLPQLLEHWPASGVASRRAVATGPADVAQSEAAAASAGGPRGAHAPALGAGPPAIPDLLDAMLAYESAGWRRRRSTPLIPRQS